MFTSSWDDLLRWWPVCGVDGGFVCFFDQYKQGYPWSLSKKVLSHRRIHYFQIQGAQNVMYMYRARTAHPEREARSPLYGRSVQVPLLKVPWNMWKLYIVLNTLSCFLSLIWKHSDTTLDIKNKKHRRSKFRGGRAPVAPPPGSATAFLPISSFWFPFKFLICSQDCSEGTKF